MKRIFALFLFAFLIAYADTFPVTNAALVSGQSKSNWASVTLTGAVSAIRTGNAGAYLKFNFTGTSVSVVVDVSSLSTAGFDAADYPRVAWSIDGGSYSSLTQLTSSSGTISCSTGLSNTTHSIEFRLISLGGPVSGTYQWIWDGGMWLTITNVIVDSGKTISAPTLKSGPPILFLGDSITCYGVDATVGGQSTTSWTYYLAQFFDSEESRNGISGAAWAAYANDFPPFSNALGSPPDSPHGSWEYIYNGQARTFSSVFQLVFISLGVRDTDPSYATVTRAGVKGQLTGIRAALTASGSSADMYIMVPFGLQCEGPITLGFADYQIATPDTKCHLIDLGAPGAAVVAAHHSGDPSGIHPDAVGSAILAGMVEPLIGAVSVSTANITTLHVGWVEPFKGWARKEDYERMAA